MVSEPEDFVVIFMPLQLCQPPTILNTSASPLHVWMLFFFFFFKSRIFTD